MTETAKCTLCGEPMPEGEEMFKFHGYSGPCPQPPINAKAPVAELEGTFPIVLYFGTEQDRDEFMELVQEAKPGMVVKKL